MFLSMTVGTPEQLVIPQGRNTWTNLLSQLDPLIKTLPLFSTLLQMI